jgi:hypothetical protein
MPAIAGSVKRSARSYIPPARSMHPVLHAVLSMLDRLVPSGATYRDAELPPDWFKYPPI